MADSEYSIDIYKSAKIRIGAVMINPEISKSIPDHFLIIT